MGRRFTVLLAEDDASVRDALAELLRFYGFNMLVAEDGDEAIELFVKYHVDVLVTDIVMPGLNGFELAAQAKLFRPQVRVLYTTAYADRAHEHDHLRYGKIIEKPFRPAELIAELRHMLSP